MKEAVHRRRMKELEEHTQPTCTRSPPVTGDEQEGGAFRSRCSSETDMSAAPSRPDRAALLVELLSAKPRPLGRSGNLRRSRVSSSNSLWTADPDRGVPPGRGPETPSNAAQSCDFSPTNQAKATSDPEQPCEHQASGELRTTSDLQAQADSRAEEKGTKEEDEGLDEGGDPGRSEDTATAATARLSHKSSLMPQLKVLDDVLHASGARGHHRDHLVIVDLEDPETVQSSSSQQEEEEGEEKVMVCCVTGVGEAAGELSDSTQEASAVPANHSPSPPPPANEKPASPVPISSQPAAAVGHLATTGAHGEEPVGVSTNHRRGTVGDQSTKDGGGAKTPVTNEKTGAASAHPSKRSSRKLLGCKSAADRTSKPRPVRVLTQSEHQTVRRVLPIRTSPRLSSADTHPEQNQRRSSGTEANLHRGQRSSTAPSSPPRGITRSLEPRSSEDQQGSPPQKQDSRPRPPTGKAGVKPRVQPEEKTCRSTLRALRGGASTSAPITPAHTSTSSSVRRSSLALPTSSLTATSSSVASFGSSPSLIRTGSLRATKSSDLHRPACSAPQDPAAAPKGHRLSGRSSRPVWR